MKKIICIYLFTLITGCKQDNEVKQPQLEPLGPVFAGVLGENMVYNDFVPDIDVDTLNNNNVDVDLNQDGVNDFRIQVVSSSTLGFLPLNTSTNKVGFCVSSILCLSTCSGCRDTYCFGRILLTNLNARINNDTVRWTLTDTNTPGGGKLTNDTYGYKTLNPSDTLEGQPLLNRFIGFKFIENTDTLYGWMRVSIMGKAHIVIHDFAYQKRK